MAITPKSHIATLPKNLSKKQKPEYERTLFWLYLFN